MKSEVIYSYDTTWFNRNGDYEGCKIIISANFDNPAAWPYTYKRYETLEDEKTEVESKNLPRDVYQKIKDVIASHRELSSCNEMTHNSVCDGTDDAYFFACDSFSRHVYGASVYSCGSFEAESSTLKKTENYIVFNVVNDIIAVLKTAGVEMYG